MEKFVWNCCEEWELMTEIFILSVQVFRFEYTNWLKSSTILKWINYNQRASTYDFVFQWNQTHLLV